MSLVFETMLGKVEVPKEVVEEIITIELSNCFHYSCPNVDVDYGDVREFLSGSRDPGLLKRIAKYILVYTENLVLSNYVYIKIRDPRGASEYLDSMKPVLKKLRDLYRLLQRKPYDVYRELINEMLHICLDNGIDPF